MKKLFLLALLCLTTSAAFALDISVPSGIRPRQMTFITNNSTVLYGATNVTFINGLGNEIFSLSTNVIIPVYIGGTTVNGINYGGTPYYTNTITTNTVYQGLAWDDVPLWPNGRADSNIPAITFWMSTLLDNNGGANGGAAGTNLWTITLARMFGTNQETLAANDLVFTINQTGPTNQITSTNLTSVFQSGATGLRLLSVKLANSTTNLFGQILDYGLSGFKP